jgi:RNA polymerase sigma factor (sigma-70 family)
MSDADALRPTWRARALPLRLRSDEWLARRAGRGDPDAFAVLYERHHRSLYRYCRSIVGNPDDAADALQSAMTRALAAIGGRDERAPVRAWLFRIAHNESISVVRTRRRTDMLEPESLIGPDVAAAAERRRQLAQLVADLRALPERQRGALLMREVGGLRHAEIATALEVSERAVKQTIYEARTTLQEFVTGREMACETVQRELSDGDGRTARSRRLRAHLRSCEACRAFRAELRARRSELAAIAPVGLTAAAVLESVIGGGAGGGGLLVGLIGGSGISKTVAVGAATVMAGAGAVTLTAVAPDVPRPERPGAAREAPAKDPRKPPEPAAVVPAPDEAPDQPGEAPERPDASPPVEQRRVVAVRRGPAADGHTRGEDESRAQPDDEVRDSPRAERDDDKGPQPENRERGEEPEDEQPEPDDEVERETPDEDEEHESEHVAVSAPELPELDNGEDEEPDDH